MLKMKDSNGSRFLRIITDQFVYGYSPLSKVADLVVDRINDPYYIFLWDHLINLWIFIVADPSILPNKREEFRDMFIHWSHIENSPIEDTFFSLKIEPFYKESILYNNHYLSKNSPKRRIFERAREATFLTWDNAHLQLILKNNGPFKQMADQSRYDMDGFPIWKGLNFNHFDNLIIFIFCRTFTDRLCSCCIFACKWSSTRSSSLSNGNSSIFQT